MTARPDWAMTADRFGTVRRRMAAIKQWLDNNPDADADLRAEAMQAASAKEQVRVYLQNHEDVHMTTRLNPFGRHAWGTTPWGPSPFDAGGMGPVEAVVGHFIPWETVERLRRAARPKKRIVLDKPEVPQLFGGFRIISF